MKLGRRKFVEAASGLLVPAVAYSFVGGWARPPLPACYVRMRDTGEIVELEPAGYSFENELAEGDARGMHRVYRTRSDAVAGFIRGRVDLVVTEEATARYDERGIVVHTTLPFGRPTPVVILGRGMS